ncbi:MAG: flagellar biosynthetic protein FliO [Oligoflexia bacterium]|nr:flagellar biosynthetic protein FliO [Oligoflexia bacterium]
MKFKQRNKFFDSVIEYFSKFLLLAFAVMILLWMISGAKASTNNKIEKIIDNSLNGSIAVELKESLNKENVKVDFERNFVQISLKNVSAYPAKNVKIEHNDIDKVFSYQFQPDLARVRILLDGKANEWEKTSSWEVQKNQIIINLTKKTSDIIASTSSANTKAELDKANQEATLEILNTANEKNTVKENKNFEDQPLFTTTPKHEEEKALSNRKSPEQTLLTILTILVLIAGSFFGLKKYLGKKGLLPSANKKVFESLATQQIGPRKSITLIKTFDRYLLIGISGENISLLKDFGKDIEIEKTLDMHASGATFGSTLNEFLSDKNSNGSATSKTDDIQAKTSVRDNIKNRIKGFKQLRA